MADFGLIAALASLAAWAGYGSAYALGAQVRWPPLGRFVKTRAGRLHVIARGEAGPPVVCLHGASANAREFSELAQSLAAEFRVYALDRPGHGHSPARAGSHRLQAQAEASAAFIEAQIAGPAIVVAHSLGAAGAVRLALDHPQLVAGLVLIAPATHPYPGDNAWHARLAAAPIAGPLFARLAVPLAGPLMAQRAIANTFAPAPVPQCYARETGVGLLFRPKTFRVNAREVIATQREFAAQYWRYDEIEQPCVILTADKDRVVSPRIHAQALAQALPRAELVTIPGAGHMPHRVRPEAAAAAVRRVAALAGLAPAR